ncbi:MAG: hypothetical protein ACI4N3_01775 [Alphaproteobacteria bacterium]
MALGKKFKGELIRSLVNILAEKGQVAIENAYKYRGYTNRLYNLHDSYGSAVYVDGILDKNTIRYLDPEMSKKGLSMGWVWTKGRSMPDFRGNRRLEGDEILMNGREEVMDFFQHYSAPKGTICLVIVAAMFYASILEQGGGRLKRKYAVISDGKNELNKLAYEFGGSVERINKFRDFNRMTTIKNKTWKQ